MHNLNQNFDTIRSSQMLWQIKYLKNSLHPLHTCTNESITVVILYPSYTGVTLGPNSLHRPLCLNCTPIPRLLFKSLSGPDHKLNSPTTIRPTQRGNAQIALLYQSAHAIYLVILLHIHTILWAVTKLCDRFLNFVVIFNCHPVQDVFLCVLLALA